MLAQLTTFAHVGLACDRITVEVGSTPGEAKFLIVGLGDTAVQESKQRVMHALRANHYRLPTGRVITVNLAPAHLRKAGPRFDLPIAVGLLLAHEMFHMTPEQLSSTAFLGELALDGSLRHVSGVLSAAIACRETGIRRLVVPAVDAAEAALIEGIEVVGASSLHEAIAVIEGRTPAPPIIQPEMEKMTHDSVIDFADIRGQYASKRALEIAAAGGHNVLLSGAPGAGKTLLARALTGILPPLTREEAIDVTRIYSVNNLLPNHNPLITKRPFRLVHHTASAVSIVGGGQVPRPGEVSLAHKGILFLDELAEFPSAVLDVLRQPLEDRTITITRAHGSITFPADFTLIAAMNPPQYSADGRGSKRRISLPLLDRIDLQIDVQPVDVADLQQPRAQSVETSAVIADRVVHARERQRDRLTLRGLALNRQMSVRDIDELCPIDAPSQVLLQQAVRTMNLSARAYHRTIKVARTIADLEGSHDIAQRHVAEALQYRQG
jgi:magnesium chelatase family protein